MCFLGDLLSDSHVEESRLICYQPESKSLERSMHCSGMYETNIKQTKAPKGPSAYPIQEELSISNFLDVGSLNLSFDDSVVL